MSAVWSLILSTDDGRFVRMRFIDKECDPRVLSPLTLAFVGDAVFELMVRESVVCTANQPAGKLHSLSVKMVKASAQASAAKRILPLLTESELSVYKRGRNAHPSHTPKNADVADYRAATGLEALFGFLYLKGEKQRLSELFEASRE